MPDDLGLNKDALLQVLATDGPLDPETVRNGWTRWWRECDFEPTVRRAIADQASDASKAEELHAFAVTYEIQLARAR